MEKYEVYFGNAYPQTDYTFSQQGRFMKLLATFNSKEEAKKFIYKEIHRIHPEKGYIRTWEENGNKWFDYGSWSEFFTIRKVGNEKPKI